ncbi:glycosyltransferase family 39 protein [Streptomyces olivochromogenes]|uniref:glycosyltransferase family 39 protein n=1 Tax=Streptomyces olivochromogenes TaxID=1963 RepID=UPI001F1ABB83|nr:glycosyltransferase family 39 protein [Streptomyces olivochromogenes]MCF3132583.1 glycosyltransferase family 39 protein [Streptomyces olivochromogenes]
MVATAPPPLPLEEIRGAAAAEPRRHRTRLLLWPFVLTLGVTGYGLTAPALGRDELITWDVVTRDTGHILATLHNVDAVHGTYYLLLHLWVSLFGDSVISMRLPSVLAASGAASVVSLIGNRLFGSRAGILAGILFALVPAVSRYAQEARSYALVILLAALATLLLLRVLDRPRNPRRWAAYALTLVGLGLLHVIALSVVAAHACMLAAHARRDRSLWWKSALALLAVAACLAPVVLLGRSQVNIQLWWVPVPNGWALLTIWQDIFASGACAGALIAFAALARSSHRAAPLLCAVWAVLPPVLVWLASQGDISYFRPAYLLFAIPAWALLAGAGLSAACHSWKAATAVLMVLAVLNLFDQRQVRQPFDHDGPIMQAPLDYRSAADLIRKHYRPGDAVVYDREHSWKIDAGVQYYLPRDLKMRDVFLQRAPRQINQIDSVDCPLPDRCLKDEQRIWLLGHGADPDPFNAINQGQASVLRNRYSPAWSRSMAGMTVTLLVRRATN